MGKVLESFDAFRVAASELVARGMFARAAGKTFGGNRDLYEALGFKTDLDVSDYRLRYERGGVAGRVVEAKPEATWRGVGELVEIENPNRSTAFETAFNEMKERLDIWSVFHNADVLAGIGRYSTIFLGAPGRVNEPLVALKPEALVYLSVFAEDYASIKKEDIERNLENPRYGKPNFYSLRGLGDQADALTKVHYTRIIHIPTDGVREDPLYGPPRLKRVWNDLDNLDKVVGGGSEAFWIRANAGHIFNLDKDARLGDTQKQEFTEQIDEFMNGMRRALKLQGVDAKTLPSEVADFSGPSTSILGLISATTGIPQRILLGSERGELASTQDRENWSDRISDRRDQYAHPTIVKPFVQRLIDLRALPNPKKFVTRWPDMESLNETEKAEILVKVTKANQQQGEIIVTTDELRDRVMGFEPLDKVDKELADKQKERRLSDAPKPAPVVQADNPDDLPVAASARVTTLEAVSAPPSVTVNLPPAAPPHIEIHVPPNVSAVEKVLQYDAAGRLERIVPVTPEAQA